MSSSRANLAKFLIPLEEIHLATQNFSSETLTGAGNVYRGELSERWQKRTAAFKRLEPHTSHLGEHQFHKELEMISSYNHENIIPFIGYCDEGKEMIIVSEYAKNGSLAHHLHDPKKSSCLTWTQRLKICIGAARALEYLHSRLGESRHRNIKAANILLDDNLEAKICDFGLSLLVGQKHRFVCDFALGANLYLDPIYKESGIVKRESDVYSFGVVMFEMLSGMLAYQRKSIGDNQPQTLINLVRRYYDEGLDKLIDPQIRDQINSRSFHVFKEIAYQCISWNLKDRPTMDKIIKSIEESLDIQNKVATSVINPIRSYQHQNLESFLIPLKEIIFVTENFSPHKWVGEGGFTRVYKGQLSEHRQNQTAAIKRYARDSHQAEHEFHNELQMISSFHHQNIISFIGYYYESDEMIIVSEYAINGSLDHHLQDPQRSCWITWAQRLKICIGVARGLEYLHSGLGEDHIVIHRDIKSGNILLDENMETKICDFGLSLLVDRNQPQVYDAPAGTQYYMDPLYEESGIVKTESDIYSFGVVLLEILTGKPAYYRRTIGGDNQPQTMIHLVRRYYDDGLDILIDPAIRDEINIHSFRAFMKIVYRCISLNIKDRPTMKRIINRIEEARDIQNHRASFTNTTQSLESYLIPLKEIKKATGDFNLETRIGKGGFGVVYRGELGKNSTVAIKCLDPECHQGNYEFHTELKLISSFHHPNIIPFVGYCDEDEKMIIVYEYACNRSLDYHLENPIKRRCLTWVQRLKICLGAAKGLDYLHSGLGKDKRVIHRDIKSGNILLDENLEAKIGDFGLSKEGPRNQQCTQVYTKAAGTNFYLDPVYHESGILSKESDVYSFGVVLFELLSGRLAYLLTKFVDGNPQYLINLVRRYYNEKPEKLIDPDIRYQIDSRCFHTFKELAYQCISLNSKERPSMGTIIDAIEDAMDFQVSHFM